MMTRTNAERAAEVARMIARGSWGPTNDDTTAVVDLLADVMHFCDARSVDFDAALSKATDHFSYEREEA